MASQTYISRRNRETGTLVIVAAPGIELDESEGWVTICNEHGSCCSHQTRRLAQQFAAEPSMWCEGCQEIVAQRKLAS